MNPLDMMKFSGLWSTFTANHPKFPKFIAAASRKGVLAEGSIIAMQIITPDGETLETNLKVTVCVLPIIFPLFGNSYCAYLHNCKSNVFLCFSGSFYYF